MGVVNGSPSHDPRPAFFGPADPGPSIYHQVHGSISLGERGELRVTTQRAIGPDRPARIAIRRWYQRPDRTWWPVADEPGVFISAPDASAFGEAVAASVRFLLEGEE